MEYRILGRTGLKVGAIALGCEGFADKTAEEVRADFDFAIRNGINFLDLYASNPELRSNIGAALAGRREKFVIQGHLCSVWESDILYIYTLCNTYYTLYADNMIWTTFIFRFNRK